MERFDPGHRDQAPEDGRRSLSRIVIIGIDGFDWPLTQSLMPEMPTVSGLSRDGYAGEMTSIFPPDSIPSWISIFTGMDPSEHGVLETIDYFKSDVKDFALETGAFEGKTFWDAAGRMGKKVIVVNPLLAYPPWEVNGIMASGPVFISGRSMMNTGGIPTDRDVPPLGGIVDFPDKGELPSFAEKTKFETSRIVGFTADLMRSNPWDLVFVSLLTMDRIFHFFWRYFDERDPTYPGENELMNVIPSFHTFLDGCIAELAGAAGDDSIIMVVSDHGHAMRPTNLFNLNQLLLDNGLLESRVGGSKLLSPRYHLERAKNLALETLHRLDMEDLAYRVAHLLPWTRKLKKGDFLTEPSKNIATASQFGGTNPFGGIDINRERCRVSEMDYEGLRDRLINLLLETKSDDGEPYFLWARRREEIYNGPFIDKFPDVLYEMNYKYGTNWSLHLPLVTVNPRHKKISGGHRKNSVLITGPLNGWELRKEAVSPLNIKRTVLEVLSDGRYDAPDIDRCGDSAGLPFLVKT